MVPIMDWKKKFSNINFSVSGSSPIPIEKEKLLTIFNRNGPWWDGRGILIWVVLCFLHPWMVHHINLWITECTIYLIWKLVGAVLMLSLSCMQYFTWVWLWLLAKSKHIVLSYVSLLNMLDMILRAVSRIELMKLIAL